MCVTPYIVRTDEGLVPVPCGKCFQCLKDWTKDWRFRLKQEWNESVACFYLTLTYDPKYLPVKYNHDAREFQSYLLKEDLQKFFKRVRKNNPDLKFRYFAVGEYGGQYNRCHFHVIFFFKTFTYRSKNQLYNYLRRCWWCPDTGEPLGFIYLKETKSKHINYVSGYFNKVDKSPHLVKPFKCMSKSLGLCYLTAKRINYFFKSFKCSVPNPNGKGYVKLPRYYRKKLDEMTCDVVPDNYGYKWSDIARMYHNDAKKGLAVEFSKFCNNYENIYAEYYRRELHDLRVGNTQFIHITPYINPNKIFYLWFRDNPVLVNALYMDKRKLDAALVQHKYTRLKENYG